MASGLKPRGIRLVVFGSLLIWGFILLTALAVVHCV
jgi:hypothetical protein